MDFTITKPTPELLRMARYEAGLTQEKAAELCGIHKASYQHHESGVTKRVSLSVYKTLLCQGGYIADPAWLDWQFRAGQIWRPENVGYTPGDLKALHWMDQSIRFLRGELYKATSKHFDQAWFHGYRYRGANGA